MRHTNLLSTSLVLRSLMFGLNLGVGVFLCGRVLSLWTVLEGTYVIAMVLLGSLLLLPLYEKLAGLQAKPKQ